MKKHFILIMILISGVLFVSTNCYACFANGTLIDIPDGTKEVQNIYIGDKVLAASIKGKKISWSEQEVRYSYGTESRSNNKLVYIHYGDNKHIIVSMNHLFLIPGNKLKHADRLIPEIDKFVDKNGGSVPVHRIQIGLFPLGIHHIATSTEPPKDINHHLINSNGVISGDYALEINIYKLKKYLADDYPNFPKIGTEE